MANFQPGLRYFLYIRSVSSSNHIERIASTDLCQTVFGAISDCIKSTPPCHFQLTPNCHSDTE
jgi:hypothetical protein